MLHFIGNPESNFKGPIKRGNRPSISFDSFHNATSCVILTDVEIQASETKEVELFVLNEKQLGQKIEKRNVLDINSPIHRIAEFIVTEHLGAWEGHSIPQKF